MESIPGESKLKKTTVCSICGGNKYKTVLSDLRSPLGEVYNLKKCCSCSFVSINPIPASANLKKYYESNYWSHNTKSNGLLNSLYSLRMSHIKNSIKKNIPADAKILDWGCGDGSLIHLLRNEGYETWGVDIFTAKPEDKLIINADITTAGFPPNFFNAVTCFHVLEHIENPLKSIQHAFNLLKDQGIMIIEVPNLDSLGFKLFKQKWQPLEIPTHINHFTTASLQKLIAKIENAKIEKVEYFSHRISPSALALSLMPFFTPKCMRKKHKGDYPFLLMISYLLLQMMIYPTAATGAIMKKGEIVRMQVRKYN